MRVVSVRLARVLLLLLLLIAAMTLTLLTSPAVKVKEESADDRYKGLQTFSTQLAHLKLETLPVDPADFKLPSNVTKLASTKDDSYTNQCFDIMEGDTHAYSKATLQMTVHPEYQIPSDLELQKQVTDCSAFKRERGYATVYDVTQEAINFPIAYSIVFHKDVGQVERLLRNIYQPQNVYCLHVDKRSPNQVQQAAKALVECFPNVFIASTLEEVVYASFSRLQADVNCMKDLASKYKKWKYLINLTGQVFPLKTNDEIVKILKIYNGANDIEGTSRGVLNSVAHRYNLKWKVMTKQTGPTMHMMKDTPHPPPPHNISLVKGSAFGVFSRAFIEYTLNDQKACDLLEWSRDTYSPDEVYWATLNHRWVNPMLNAPGNYDNAVPERKPWLAMYSSWKNSVPKGPCAGKYVHSICIFSLRDLPNLISRKELFANKFFRDYEPMTFDCLEKWLKVKASSSLPFDSQYYRDLPYVIKS